MDPIETINTLNDAQEDSETRTEALEDLALWIARGGAVPNDAPEFTDETERAMNNEEQTDLLAAVRCAINNADRSALRGLGFTLLN